MFNIHSVRSPTLPVEPMNMMPSNPSLVICHSHARQRQPIADQLVFGILAGGFMGPGVEITERGADKICFSRSSQLFAASPRRGEILLSNEATGSTKVECRLWCSRWNPRRVIGVGGGLLLIFALLLTGPGVSIPWFFGVSFAGILLVEVLGQAVTRATLKRRMLAYLRNLDYLKMG
jgi:hypothetical protein